MEFVELTYEQEGQIAIIILNRPNMRHAFNTAMAKELLATFQCVKIDEVRVVILTSSTLEDVR